MNTKMGPFLSCAVNYGLTATKKILTKILLIFLSLVLTNGNIVSQTVSVGSGSYTTTLPAGKNGPTDINDSPLSPAITNNITGAVPTQDWGSSIVFKRDPANSYSHIMFAHPLGMECRAEGLAIGYANEVSISENSYVYGLPKDLVIGFDGLNSPDAKLDSYGDWTQTASWNNRDLVITFGHGLPFVYIEYSTPGALITCAGEPVFWSNNSGILGITIGTRHYGIFGPSGASWTIDNTSIRSNLDNKTYLSIAVLPDNTEATLDFFSKYAYAFVTDTRVTWEYDRMNSMVITNFDIETDLKEGNEESTIIALYPHQWKNTTQTFTDYTYISPRSTMKVITGKGFTTAIQYTGILPALPDAMVKSPGYNPQTLAGYIDDMESHSADQLIRANSDTYWTGKDMGKVAQLVRIAEQIHDNTARDYFLDILKMKLEGWLTAGSGETDELFYHNEEWGTLIGYGDSYGSAAELNDHHFHYGYFIVAAATVAQYDRDWTAPNAWGGMVETIIRDVANTQRGDSFSPFLRTFDPYAGHSWASGHANFGDANNQESSSESINFATGLALWASATGNDKLCDLAAYLYSTEVEALQNYWMDVHGDIFPDGFTKCTVGIIWGGKADHSTWFSSEPEMIHGIIMLPITGGSLYLGHFPDYVLTNYNEIVTENNGAVDDWKDIIWEFLAFADPEAAIQAYNNDPSFTPEDGETKAHSYHFIHNLNVLGQVDRSVTADIPTYAVFNNSGTKAYVIYNPENSPVKVAFSDGAVFTAPADTLIFFGIDDVDISDYRFSGQDAATDNKISLNYSKDVIYIRIPSILSDELSLSMFDPMGREIDFRILDNLSKNKSIFSLGFSEGSVGNGVYILHLKAGKEIIEKRFIIAK